MPVDVSSYPTAATAPDPLASIGKILQIQGAQQALQIQQQEFKARQALGPILQQSIDPKTGELDINKFLVHGAANPDVAWKMPEITLQMIQRQNTQADTVVKQLQANKVRYGAMGDGAGALIAQAEEEAAKNVNLRTGGPGTPGITNKQLATTLSTFVGENGLLESTDAAEILGKTATMTPQERFQWVKNFANAARGVDKTMGDIYGAITQQNVGGHVVGVQASPLLKKSAPVGSVEITPSPEAMNATTPGVDQQGRPVIRPRVEAAPMYGGSGQQIPGSGQGAAPVGGPAANVTGLSPFDKKLQEGRAKQAEDYESDLQGANLQAQETKRVLTAMRDELKNFKPGSGTEVKGRIAGLLQSVGAPQKLVDEVAGGDFGSIQSFNKLANLLATAQMKSAMGSSQRFTNLDFSTFTNKNIRGDTDPRAIDKMMGFLNQGITRMKIQSDAHQYWKEGHRPKGYEKSDMSSFPNYWANELDKLNRPEEK